MSERCTDETVVRHHTGGAATASAEYQALHIYLPLRLLRAQPLGYGAASAFDSGYGGSGSRTTSSRSGSRVVSTGSSFMSGSRVASSGSCFMSGGLRGGGGGVRNGVGANGNGGSTGNANGGGGDGAISASGQTPCSFSNDDNNDV